MAPTVLTQDVLNRTLLARQGLLTPFAGPLGATVEAIGAIQAQYWPSVAVSLFTRNSTATLWPARAATSCGSTPELSHVDTAACRRS